MNAVSESVLAPRPAHVPADRVVEFDIYHPPGFKQDIHLAFHKLHDGPDIVWTPYNGGHWIVTRAADIEYLQKNHDPFSMRSVSVPTNPAQQRALPIETDPPEHTQYRAIVSPWFTPKSIEELGVLTRQLAIDLIEGFKSRGHCEFVKEFAQQLPIAIFCKLTNVPFDDRTFLLEWTDWSLRGTPQQRAKAFENMTRYIDKLIADRRANPGPDIISDVLRATINGAPITHTDAQSMLIAILFGGLDTVAATMGFITRFLAGSPAHRKQLAADPSIIPAAIEELMRRHGVTNTARTLTRDYDYQGVHFKQGDKVMVPTLMFGLDERRYENPLTVDFGRKQTPHAGFGNGPHRCPGSFLARTEIKVFLEEWFKRIPDFSIDPNKETVLECGLVHSVIALPLVWKV